MMHDNFYNRTSLTKTAQLYLCPLSLVSLFVSGRKLDDLRPACLFLEVLALKQAVIN